MGYRIGITIGLTRAGESLWINGIKQNALALAALFSNSDRGHEVVLLNTTEISISNDLDWDLQNPRTLQLKDFQEPLDLLIALGGALSQEHVDAWRSRGCKVIAYKCGAEYVMSSQATLFNRPMGGAAHFVRHLDAIWAIPQLGLTTTDFYQALHRCPVQIVPFIWDPIPLEALCVNLPNSGLYQPSSAPKSISVFEPNVDILKFCLYPILASELAFRKDADAIDHLYVVNGFHLKSNPEFLGIMSQLDIVNSHRASFETRHLTANFLSEYTDLVVSHQWGLPLNYLYFEVCWLGYPLVHNAELCSDLGYYYRANKIDQAADMILRAIKEHDSTHRQYLSMQRERIARFLPTGADNIRQYDKLIDELMNA